MDLSGIVFAALIILVVLGTVAGILIVVNAGDRGQRYRTFSNQMVGGPRVRWHGFAPPHAPKCLET